MKKEKEKNCGMVFKNHYEFMPENDRVAFRDTYIGRTKMPQATFYHKLSTETFRVLELMLFEEMLKEYYLEIKRILIIGRQGSGKTVLANTIGEITDLPVFDDLVSINAIKEDDGVYVLHCYPEDIEGLDSIHIINLKY